jgi:dihydroflavonol-4-reductase
MKIFITGATGFIGTHLVKRLTSMDHRPVCFVRKSSNIRELEKLGVDFAQGDLKEKISLRSGMEGCDWVIHLAGVSSFWEQDNSIYTDVNVTGTRNVMECALDAGISKVLHLSTMAVYGRPAKAPFHEGTTIGPKRFSRYARTKYEGERIAWGLYIKKALPLVVCYPGIVLGSGSQNHTSGIIKRLIQQTMPAKAFLKSIHTYTHVNDVTETIIWALEKDDTIGQRYFIGNYRIPTEAMLRMISSLSGARLPRITLPDSVAMLWAYFFTSLAYIIQKPPAWGMAVDFARTAREGMIADGNRAQRELGITYSPIKDALIEEIDFIRSTQRLYDRRRSDRVHIDMNIAYKAEGQDHEMRAHLNNISVGGMFIETEQPSTKGKYVSANLFGDKPGHYFYVRGKVLRKTHSGMAVEITHADRDIHHLFSEMR